MMNHSPDKWFWIVGSDADRVYSSAAAQYVPVTDESYTAFVEAGGFATRIINEDELKDVFAQQYPAGWHFPKTRLTGLEFMNRLSTEESAAIATAAQSNASVLVWLLKLSAATYVDLTDQQTIEGVNAIKAAGLLTADRAAELLAI
ncbi:hypothetical protein [Paracraurococcus lichenis]|uniref:Uncharacterized protein n=1 Tax=Paracraurococcus lichenis TaxID=3064888 RepID=A0ABT9E4E4_9PROT|nr:hypothetical protein [Paracraurococcus sp. LOR1-02]MDO9711039.1 hypothetical protein [Paracraurococcus sp. LOR1-02]